MRESGYVDLNNYSAGGTLNFIGLSPAVVLFRIINIAGGAGGGRIACV